MVSIFVTSAPGGAMDKRIGNSVGLQKTAVTNPSPSEGIFTSVDEK
jgi:hypothetical protein